VEKGVVYEGEGKTGRVRPYFGLHSQCQLAGKEILTIIHPGSHIFAHQETHPNLRVRRRLHSHRLHTRPDHPHPRTHDPLVHCRRLLYRKALSAMACLRGTSDWRRGPKQRGRGNWKGERGGSEYLQCEQHECGGNLGAAEG
jgi:hypothetical protein